MHCRRGRLTSTIAVIAICAMFVGPAGSAYAAAGDSWTALIADYREYHLPLPPKEAVLAIRRPSWRTTINGVEQIVYYLSLIEGTAGKAGNGYYWVGCDKVEFDLKEDIREEVAPTKESLAKTEIVPFSDQPEGFTAQPDLALAIQCRLRGWNDLAQALLERSHWYSDNDLAFNWPPPPLRDDRKALALVAWNYWCNQFADLGSDRRAVIDRLKRILKSQAWLDSKARRTIIADMESTLVERKVPRDSLEAAVERLRELDLAGSS